MTLERGAKTRLITAAVLVLVAMAGIVVGVALERELGGRSFFSGELRRPESQADRSMRGREGEDRSRGVPGRRGSLLVEQVGLSPEQKEKVDSIVTSYHDRMRALHEEFNDAYMPRYRKILEDTRDDIRALLSDEQRSAYDSILVADRRRRDRRPDSVSDQGGSRDEN